jgi:ATP-dependent RNA/DNA helicase IGHMBP2
LGGISPSAKERLEALSRLLGLEEQTARERTDALLKGKTAKELEQAGVLLRQARVGEVVPAMFGRARVTLGEQRAGQIDGFDVRPGAIVWLMERDDDGALQQAASGVVVRRARGRLDVVFDSSEDAADVDELVDVLRAEDAVTLRRMREGLARCVQADGRTARLVEVLLGAAPPRATRKSALAMDPALNDDQQIAARHGVLAEDLALIHGPPGTGKTRVLVEVIRQCVMRGERVLAMAASNAAVDHLALCVLAAEPGIKLARLGHPARAHPDLEQHTLAALTDEHEHKKIAKGLVDQAFTLLRQARKRSARGRDAHKVEREVRAEAGRLFADARRLERQAAQAVLEGARVLCSTLTGQLMGLGDDVFDVLVVDEASQALTPALLLGVPFAKRVVLAGDHMQLPPTVLSLEAARAGLANTAFAARCEADAGSEISHMLTVQHRMHEQLMAFPSERFYDGRLRAHGSVAHHLLADLGVTDDDVALPARVLDVIDTAGSGFEEASPDGSDSKHNLGEAGVIARLVRALVSDGLGAAQIGVITPYAGQVAELVAALSDLVDAGLEVDSVDGFQGREKEAILFSAVRSNANGEVGFLDDVRRLNVAVTRARRKLIVLGDSATLSTNETWRALFDHAIAVGAYRSVFELPPEA